MLPCNGKRVLPRVKKMSGVQNQGKEFRIGPLHEVIHFVPVLHAGPHVVVVGKAQARLSSRLPDSRQPSDERIPLLVVKARAVVKHGHRAGLHAMAAFADDNHPRAHRL